MPTELPTETPTEASADAPNGTPAGEELPENLYLAPSRARWIFVLVASAIIVTLNLIFVLQTGSGPLWIFVAIFTTMGLLAGSQLVPGSAGLWLDRSGFTYRRFWKDTRREWTKISPILASQVGIFGSQVALLQMVGFHNAEDPENKPREILPDTYGISAEELAVLMNHWRNTAIRARS